MRFSSSVPTLPRTKGREKNQLKLVDWKYVNYATLKILFTICRYKSFSFYRGDVLDTSNSDYGILYLRVQIVHFFNGVLHITTLHCLLDSHSISYSRKINVGYKLIRKSGVLIPNSSNSTKSHKRDINGLSRKMKRIRSVPDSILNFSAAST